MKLPQFSIAAKLYAIFALLATVTVGARRLWPWSMPRRHAALTERVRARPSRARQNVERVNGLIYARRDGDRAASTCRGRCRGRQARMRGGLVRFNDRIGDVVTEWQQSGAAATTPDAVRRVRRAHRSSSRNSAASSCGVGTEGGPAGGARDGATATPTAAFARRSTRISRRLPTALCAARRAASTPRSTSGIDATAWLAEPARRLAPSCSRPSAPSSSGARWRGRSPRSPASPRRSPAARSTATVPYRERGDEVGALARSIAVFQDAMRRNEELNRTVRRGRAGARRAGRRRWRPRSAAFGAEVEATLSELGRISDQMLAASRDA